MPQCLKVTPGRMGGCMKSKWQMQTLGLVVLLVFLFSAFLSPCWQGNGVGEAPTLAPAPASWGLGPICRGTAHGSG